MKFDISGLSSTIRRIGRELSVSFVACGICGFTIFSLSNRSEGCRMLRSLDANGSTFVIVFLIGRVMVNVVPTS